MTAAAGETPYDDSERILYLESQILPREESSVLTRTLIQGRYLAKKQSLRVIMVTQKSIQEDAGLVHVIIPPSETFPHAIHLFQLSGETKECPDKYCKLKA